MTRAWAVLLAVATVRPAEAGSWTTAQLARFHRLRTGGDVDDGAEVYWHLRGRLVNAYTGQVGSTPLVRFWPRRKEILLWFETTPWVGCRVRI